MIVQTLTREKQMLSTIERTIATYRMFDHQEEVFVAFSGGKDSLATVLLLSQLGYRVRPLTVHTGDPLFNWQIVVECGREARFSPEVLRAGSPGVQQFLCPKDQQAVLRRLELLSKLSEGSNKGCAHCYYVKMYTLCGVVRSKGGSGIVLGQHRDDMLDSLLKCYWIDLYFSQLTKPRGIPYDGAQMKSLMAAQKEINEVVLKDLVDQELAATDEPFVEKGALPDGIRILRPLGEVPEEDIVAYLRSRRLGPTGDQCSFKKSWTKTTKAFRLIVHDDRELRAQRDPGLDSRLFEFALMGLTEEGTWRFRPRNTRDKNYPGFKPFIRKL